MTQKISTILKTTDRKQMVGDLVKWKWKDGENTGEALKYCALGVLACNKKLITPDYEPEYRSILRAYGIPSDLINLDYSHVFDFKIPNRDNRKQTPKIDPVYPRTASSLSELIVCLNDKTKLSFKEIGEFLAVSLGI